MEKFSFMGPDGLYKDYYGSSEAQSALLSWHVDYTKTDDFSVIEQLTENIALAEMVLRDKEHINENIDQLTEMINSLKVYGAAAINRRREERQNTSTVRRFQSGPVINSYLTADELKEVESINKKNQVNPPATAGYVDEMHEMLEENGFTNTETDGIKHR